MAGPGPGLPADILAMATLLATFWTYFLALATFLATLQADLSIQDDFPAVLQADLSVQDGFLASLQADLSVHDDILDLFEVVDVTCMRDAHTSCRHNSATVLWRVHTSIYIYIYKHLDGFNTLRKNPEIHQKSMAK